MPKVSAITLVTQPGMVAPATDFLDYLLGTDIEPIKIKLVEGEGFDNETRLTDASGEPIPTTMVIVTFKDPSYMYYIISGLRYYDVTHAELKDGSELVRHEALQCLFLFTC